MAAVIPIFVTQDLAVTEGDYVSLGFEVDRTFVASGYLMVWQDDIELHFTVDAAHVPAKSAAACFIRSDEAAEIHARWKGAGWGETGIPRLTLLEPKPWGMTEFALVDSAGNLLRVGFESR